MTCDEFADLIDKISEEYGFKCEYLLIMSDEKGKLCNFSHVWNENLKPCKIIRLLSKILKIGCKKFKKIY